MNYIKSSWYCMTINLADSLYKPAMVTTWYLLVILSDNNEYVHVLIESKNLFLYNFLISQVFTLY